MIELWNVNKTYETGNKALRNINITVEDGEFVFIIGRSGSGKSTLLKLLLKVSHVLVFQNAINLKQNRH